MTDDAVIETRGLTHAYGRRRRSLAVDRLDLAVRAGEVVGLLGHNGAGKTTTVKALVGLLKPREGSCRVLGLDPWTHGPEVRRRTGYVPESLTTYDWMSVEEVLRFVSSFHPTWDRDLEGDLVRRLELPLDQAMGELSRGTRAKVHLACAVAFRPEALILDDPTSGLDALVRREVLEQVIELAADGGRAVLFSSHVLDEVERLADRVAIVVGGRKVMDRPLAELKESLRRVSVRLAPHAPGGSAGRVPGALSEEREGELVVAVVDGAGPDWRAELEAAGGALVAEEELDLEEAFVQVVKASQAGRLSAATRAAPRQPVEGDLRVVERAERVP